MNILYNYLRITLLMVIFLHVQKISNASLLDQIDPDATTSASTATPVDPIIQAEKLLNSETLQNSWNPNHDNKHATEQAESMPQVVDPAPEQTIDFTQTANNNSALTPEQKDISDTEERDSDVFENEQALRKKGNYAYLGDYLTPWKNDTTDEKIEFLFDNAELSTLLQYVEHKFKVTFILDDSIQPLPQGGKSILGTKISFRTHKPLNKKDAWNLFVAFLDMAGLAPVPGPVKNTYRLMQTQDPKSPQSATRAPLPTFVGVDPSLIPNNDTRIRYVYFVENASLDTIKNVVDSMKSVTAPNLMILPELNAIIITDKASNIKSMLTIVKELDQANMPESLAVIKLKRTDATKAAQLYDALTKKEAPGLAARLLGARRQPTTEYFPEGARVIAEPRTNSLIILGSRDSIKKISDFIVSMIDKQDTLPEIPLYVYRLKYLDAESIASILQQATQFQPGSEAAKAGGVRDGDKYFKPMTIAAEKTTNSIIINADYEDYSKIYDLLQKIDTEQPQVALKVFIMTIDITDNKAFGTQIRNKIPGVEGLIGKDTNFQTSGLNGSVPGAVVENTSASATGATRLLGDLVSLASGINTIGSTVVSLGSDMFGVWGMLNMLQTYQRATLLANPFLVTTHKYPAQFSIGEKRYVITSTVFANPSNQNTFGYVDANLTIQLTPQISRDNLVTLDTNVILDQFVNADPNSQNGNRTSRRLQTSVTLADNEVLALGGLIRETTTTSTTGIPILENIPLLGWFFKNKAKNITKNSLLILIVPEIIKPANLDIADGFTASKVLDAKDLMEELRNNQSARDPVHRWLFNDAGVPREEQFMNAFETNKARYTQIANTIVKPDITKIAAKLNGQESAKPQESEGEPAVLKHSLLEAAPAA